MVSDTIKMVRALDPDRPIVANSSYARGRQEYEEDLKPHQIDDGDIDDIHVCNSWYGPSALFVDVREDIEKVHSQYPRPLISQEAATGYPDNDSGYPVPVYTFNHFVPQAWLGEYVFDASNPFLRFHARTTQDWMEKIRRHRSAIAGWLLFSNCNWFRYAWDAQRIEPFPTYYSAKYALQPVLVSLESPDRHFVKGGSFITDVYIVNDDAQYRDWQNLVLEWSITSPQGEVLRSGSPVSGALGLNSAKYYYVYDFWNDRLVGKLPGSVRLEQDLRPGEARMMSVHEALDHPQFISTNRHIMQGYIDLPRTEWDDARMRLCGTSLVVGGETYKVIIATNGYRPRIATARHASAQVRNLNGNPELAELSIDRAEKGPVEWSITFSH